MDCANLDSEFDQAMYDIRNNISFLENEIDMMVLSSWIIRLSEPTDSLEEKIKRNEYIAYLLYLLKRQMIHQPFVELPPQGPLPPLNVSMTSPTCGSKCLKSNVDASSSSKGTSFQSFKSQQSTRERRPSETSPKKLSRSGILKNRPVQPTSLLPPEAPVQAPSPHRPQSITPQMKGSSAPPCAVCPKPKRNLVEKPGSSLIETKEHGPCPHKKRPSFSPPGYLDFSSEVDTKPFFPPLPGTEEMNLEMKRVLESVDECTRLFDFIRNIGPTTCDQGQLLNFTANAEITQFKDFVQSLYRTRMEDTEELLTKEQIKLKERYEEWEIAVTRRTETGLRGLQRLLPEFCKELYEKDPEYIYYLLKGQYSVEEEQLHPQIRILRIKAQKRRWLTDEAERIEKENEDRSIEIKDLNDQLNSLSRCYNAQHKEYLKRNRCLEENAAQLRIRLHQNQKMINAVIDELNTSPSSY